MNSHDASSTSKQTGYTVFENDLPDGHSFAGAIAVDTEAMGLNPHRDRLCLVQLADEAGQVAMVHFKTAQAYHNAVNLKRLLQDTSVEKIFHFARFDVAIMQYYLGVTAQPLFCTKIASKLSRTFVQRHGLKDLCRDLLGVHVSKEEQTSDWGAPVLTAAQLNYAAQDVLYLHRLKEALVPMLQRVDRWELAKACFDFIPQRCTMDLLGWQDDYIFSY